MMSTHSMWQILTHSPGSWMTSPLTCVTVSRVQVRLAQGFYPQNFGPDNSILFYSILFYSILFYSILLFIYLRQERREEGKKWGGGERERDQDQFVGCFSIYLYIHLLILVCALTADGTHNLGVSGWCSNLLSYLARAGPDKSYFGWGKGFFCALWDV